MGLVNISSLKILCVCVCVWEDINVKQRPILLQKYNLFQAKKLKQ